MSFTYEQRKFYSHVICLGTKIQIMAVTLKCAFYSHVICLGTKMSNHSTWTSPFNTIQHSRTLLQLVYHTLRFKKSYFWYFFCIFPFFTQHQCLIDQLTNNTLFYIIQIFFLSYLLHDFD